ncbi:MAG: MATE family efflux transporter [Calditrichia bacterium]|nr:MATE family efflux transporter [Calditrichia bacterium]
MLNEQQKIKLKQIFSDIIASIKGNEQDFTSGSIRRAIFLLSIPMVLEMVMESVFAVVDIFFVSKLGADAVATVGLTEAMVTIIYAIAIGLAMATTATIARRIGEKEPDKAAFTSFQAIILGFSFSLIIAIIGIFFSKDMLRLMGASANVIEEGYLYPTILIGTNTVIMMLFIINAVFRGAGDAAISMRVLWLANIINVVLDPCLIFGIGPFPELGVAGAAVATSIGRGIGVLWQFYWLFKPTGRITIHKKHVILDFKIIRNLVRISLGGIGQFLISTSSWIGLMRIIAVFGSEALAGYTIAIRIFIFSLLPSWGMSNAAATLVGQNLGAKKPDRAEKSVWMSGKINAVFLIIVAFTFISFPEFLIKLFTGDLKVIATGAEALRIISYGYVFYAYGMVLVQAFNGAGDTATPTKINFICFWLIEIPLAYTLALKLRFGVSGVFWAIVIAETLLTVIGIIMFKRGSWKSKKV